MEKEIIEILPNGWLQEDTILIETNGNSRCGDEEHGLHIELRGFGGYGGVLRREDMQKMIDIFTAHLKEFPSTQTKVVGNEETQ